MSEIDAVLARIAAGLDLDAETEYEVLCEMRDHLEEAAADARAAGLDEDAAVAHAAACFGLEEEVTRQLHAVHAGWGTADAVVAAALPVVCALVLRWLAFAPDGTALGWPQLLSRPTFWIVACAALLLPVLKFERWHYALAAWGFFWMLTILFVTLPAAHW